MNYFNPYLINEQTKIQRGLLHERLSEEPWLSIRITSEVYGKINGLAGKESACNAEDTGDMSLIPTLGRFPGEGNGNLLQYSCLQNPMDRGAW